MGLRTLTSSSEPKPKNCSSFKHQLHASNLTGSVFLSCMRPLVLQLHGICVVSLKNTELAFQKKNHHLQQPINKSQTTLLTAAAFSEGWEQEVESEWRGRGKGR